MKVKKISSPPKLRMAPSDPMDIEIEPFMLPMRTRSEFVDLTDSPKIAIINNRIVVDLTDSPKPKVPVHSRLADVIDLTDSPNPHFVKTRMEFQSPVPLQEIIEIDQECKESPRSVVEELFLNLKSGDEAVDTILLNGTP